MEVIIDQPTLNDFLKLICSISKLSEFICINANKKAVCLQAHNVRQITTLNLDDNTVLE